MLAFTETKLIPSFITGELWLNNYSVFRFDRDAQTSQKSGGGGCILALDSRYSCTRLPLLNNNVEQIFIKITFGPNLKQLVLGVVYIPPDAPLESYEAHWEVVDHLRNQYVSDCFIILGDYNLPDCVWGDPSTSSFPSGHSEKSRATIENVFFLNLHQHNNILNSNGKTLDLIFSTAFHYECSVAAADPLLPVECHHPPLLFTLKSLYLAIPKSADLDDETIYNFKKGNYGLINRIFDNFDWPTFLNENNSVDTNSSLFISFVSDVIKCFIPSYVKKHDSFPHWYSPHLKRLLIEKKKNHHLFKSSGLPHFYHQFSFLRSICKSLSETCYSRYLSSVEFAVRRDPRYFWKYERTMRKDQSLPKNLHLGNLEAHSIPDALNLFSRYFSSAYSLTPTCSPELNLPNSDTISSTTISESDIRLALFKLNPHKGMGPDGIPPLFLKKCFYTLSSPLHFIFNQSLSAGSFPSSWKHSFIKPIPKKGLPKSEISNYRPISILSTIPKLFESLLLDQILPFFLRFIIVNQHGFVPNKSVTSLFILIFFLNSSPMILK